MQQRIGPSLLLLICAAVVWALVLLEATPNRTAVAAGGGLLGMAAASLMVFVRPSIWKITERAVAAQGQHVLYLPGVAGLVLGVTVTLLALGVVDGLGIQPSKPFIMGIGSFGGLMLGSWPIRRFETSGRTQPAHILSSPDLGNGGTAPRRAPFGPVDYQGRLELIHESTPHLGVIAGRLRFRFIPDRVPYFGAGAAGVHPSGPDPKFVSTTRWNAIHVDGGRETEAVPFEVRVSSVSFHSNPATTHITVPAGKVSPVYQIDLLYRPNSTSRWAPATPLAGAPMENSGRPDDTEEVVVEVRQFNRPVQSLTLTVPVDATAALGDPDAPDGSMSGDGVGMLGDTTQPSTDADNRTEADDPETKEAKLYWLRR